MHASIGCSFFSFSWNVINFGFKLSTIFIFVLTMDLVMFTWESNISNYCFFCLELSSKTLPL
jgi:hypothetical protein